MPTVDGEALFLTGGEDERRVPLPPAPPPMVPAMSREERRQRNGGVAPADDLTRIKGIGPGTAAKLKKLGVLNFGQVARLDAETLKRPALDALGSDEQWADWIAQAKALAGNGEAPAA